MELRISANNACKSLINFDTPHIMTKIKKQDYFIPANNDNFASDWKLVKERLKKVMPLKDHDGNIVGYETAVFNVDFTAVADCLKGEPDETGIIQQFMEAVEKKSSEDKDMTVKELLSRPAGELTRWRNMRNRVALLPNALVMHMNLLVG